MRIPITIRISHPAGKTGLFIVLVRTCFGLVNRKVHCINVRGRAEVTTNLIIQMLGVDEKWVHPLPMNSTTVLPDTGGVEVTLIEANHCTSSLPSPISIILTYVCVRPRILPLLIFRQANDQRRRLILPLALCRDQPRVPVSPLR